jgi:hypothetical protein
MDILVSHIMFLIQLLSFSRLYAPSSMLNVKLIHASKLQWFSPAPIVPISPHYIRLGTATPIPKAEMCMQVERRTADQLILSNRVQPQQSPGQKCVCTWKRGQRISSFFPVSECLKTIVLKLWEMDNS